MKPDDLNTSDLNTQNVDTSTISKEALWTNNSAMVQMLGLCPLLAVSNTLINGFVLGVLTIAVLIGANTAISLIRSGLNDTTRLPAQILIIASFVTLADFMLQMVSFEIHQRIGLFVALIVTNCAILGRTEAFARKNSVGFAALDGLMTGLGFFAVIALLSSVREIMGQGTLFTQAELIFGAQAANWTIHFPFDGILLAVLPPGAFILFGLLIAAKNWIDIKIEQRQTIRNLDSASS
jgi:Na+-translocating ferredoxin:NAD+ oxidoreductase subunit E